MTPNRMRSSLREDISRILCIPIFGYVDIVYLHLKLLFLSFATFTTCSLSSSKTSNFYTLQWDPSLFIYIRVYWPLTCNLSLSLFQNVVNTTRHLWPYRGFIKLGPESYWHSICNGQLGTTIITYSKGNSLEFKWPEWFFLFLFGGYMRMIFSFNIFLKMHCFSKLTHLGFASLFFKTVGFLLGWFGFVWSFNWSPKEI